MGECLEEISPITEYVNESITNPWTKKEIQGIYFKESDFQKSGKRDPIEDKPGLLLYANFEKRFRNIYFRNNLEIELSLGESIVLPVALIDIARRIESSRKILELKDNWDDEGSVRYRMSTWIRSVKILAESAKNIFEKSEKLIDAPRIAPGPNGGIDFIWEMNNYDFLVTIPENEREPGSFYGEGKNNNHIEGTFEQNGDNFYLMLCLMTI